MFDEPAVVLLAAAAAAAFLLAEVALPTFGLAGAAGGALALLAAWGAGEQGDAWWPLLGVVAAVVVWGVLVARHRRTVASQAIAAELFLFGGLGYAGTTGDMPAAVTAVVTTALLAGLAFPRIAAGADDLNAAPPQVGMESLVGAAAVVAGWEGTGGKVSVTGTLWSATGPSGLQPGDEVVIVATSGLSVKVEGVASRHG